MVGSDRSTPQVAKDSVVLHGSKKEKSHHQKKYKGPLYQKTFLGTGWQLLQNIVFEYVLKYLHEFTSAILPSFFVPLLQNIHIAESFTDINIHFKTVLHE